MFPPLFHVQLVIIVVQCTITVISRFTQVGTTEVPATGTSSVSRLAAAAGRRGLTTPATYIDTAALSTREEEKI